VFRARACGLYGLTMASSCLPLKLAEVRKGILPYIAGLLALDFFHRYLSGQLLGSAFFLPDVAHTSSVPHECISINSQWEGNFRCLVKIQI
jgi:hypothetical protein